MIQHVDGRDVYVVEFDVMPILPITGVGIDGRYAEALTAALAQGIITKPGKYGVFIDWTPKAIPDNLHWEVFKITEEDHG